MCVYAGSRDEKIGRSFPLTAAGQDHQQRRHDDDG